MDELTNLIIQVLKNQRDDSELPNQMSADEIYWSIVRKFPLKAILLPDVRNALNQIKNVSIDKLYFYEPTYLMDVNYESPFCKCTPSRSIENQTQDWIEYSVCVNCNRPIEGSDVPIDE